MNDCLNILVIDDSEVDRRLYRRVLNNVYGDRLKLAEETDGERGLNAIGTADPHCVLLDYSLPGEHGIEVLKRIRTKHPHLPIILLTGQGNEAIAVQSMKEGAQDYIAKSAITPETLSKAIRTAIETSALRQRVAEQHVALELFTHALAHDLREPVRAVCSFAGMVNEHETGREERIEYMRLIRDAGTRMAVLIDAVLSYMRLESMDPPPPAVVSLNEAMNSTKANLFSLLRERGASMSVDALPEVMGNRIQIIQVLQNLVSNAVIHSPHPVNLTIGATHEGDRVRVFVRDDGPGIAPDHQRAIFEPFRRLNSGNDHHGLGLAICQKVIKAHGGEIGCESEPGQGSCFFFLLPAATPVKDVRIGGAPICETNGTARVANVLMIDDRDDDILITRSVLTGSRGMHCNVLVAHDGEQGLAAMRDPARENDPVDLVLLDINMPVMNGFEMLQTLREDPAYVRIPVVMCSGSTRDKDKEQARVLGALGYLAKPAFFKDLRPIINKASSLSLVDDGTGRPVLTRIQ